MIITKKKVPPLFGEERFHVEDKTPKGPRLPIDFEFIRKAKRVILQVDGGGILGIMAAHRLYLTELEFKKAYPGESLAQYITHLYGTSTGSIIVRMVERKFSFEDILMFYINDGPKVFVEKGLFGKVFSDSLFDSTKLRAKMRMTLTDYTLEECYNQTKKEVNIAIYSKTDKETIIFNHKTQPKSASWETTFVSTQAPMYFLPWKMKIPNIVGKDGGTTGIFNCLLNRLVDDILYENPEDPKQCYVISLGTGREYKDADTSQEAVKKQLSESKLTVLKDDVVSGGRDEATRSQVKRFVRVKEKYGLQGFRWDVDLPKGLSSMSETNNIDELIALLEKNRGAVEVIF